MKLKAYDLTEQGGIRPRASSEMHHDWFSDDVVRWVDVTASSTEEIEHLLSPLDLHRKVLAAATAREARPEVIAFEKQLFVRMPYLSKDGEHRSLRLICGPTAIVSARTAPLLEIEELAEALEAQDRTIRSSAADLLIEILEAVLREGRPAALGLREEIADVTEQLEIDSGEVAVADLMTLKRRTSALAGHIESQLICLGNLTAIRSSSLSLSEVKDDLQALIKILEQIRPIVLRLDEQARELRQAHAGMLQEASNRRLNVLAVLSAIYLPATLIAGIYGMNFDDIPASKLAGGYLFVLALMIALVAGQLLFFWRRGWFK